MEVYLEWVNNSIWESHVCAGKESEFLLQEMKLELKLGFEKIKKKTLSLKKNWGNSLNKKKWNKIENETLSDYFSH